MTGWAVVAVSYALGCVVTAYYVVRFRTGKDLRDTGSGTAGATNAGRLLGKGAYIGIALADITKGVLAAWLAGGLSDWWQVAAGLAVVAGHIWPVQLRGRGGKGLATAYGVICWQASWTALGMWGVLAIMRLFLKKTVPAGLASFAAAPVISWACGLATPCIVLQCGFAALLAFTHREHLAAKSRNRLLPTEPQ